VKRLYCNTQGPAFSGSAWQIKLLRAVLQLSSAITNLNTTWQQLRIADYAGVRNFVCSIVVNILRKILIQLRKSFSVGRITTFSPNHLVLNASEFVVLQPEIGFQTLCGCSNRSRPASSEDREPADCLLESCASKCVVGSNSRPAPATPIATPFCKSARLFGLSTTSDAEEHSRGTRNRKNPLKKWLLR
jgi:hypothetical protein